MASTFFGLNIARSGLFASQRALNVISHNVANADTKGYSRQRLDQSQYKPMELGGNNGMLGTGVNTDAVKQIRNEFLDYKYRDENTLLGEWSFKKEMFSMIESVFNEPSDSGIAVTVNQFFEATHELSKNPESLTTRALVRQRAIALTSNLGRMHDKLVKTQKDMNFQLLTDVSEINGYAKEIAAYNKTIYSTEVDGGVANDIRDKRNLVVDKLSKLTNVDSYEDDEGRFHVIITGMPLVSHFTANQLVTVKRPAKVNPDDANDLIDVKWSTGATFEATGGEIKGLLNMRDGKQEYNKGIPYYVEQLNVFTNTLLRKLNDVHKEGFTLNDPKNKAIVTQAKTDSGLTAAQIESVNVELKTYADPSSIVSNDVAVKLGLDPTGTEKLVNAYKNGYSLDAPDSGIRRFIPLFKELPGSDGVTTANEWTISDEVDKNLNLIAASSTMKGVPGNRDAALKLAEVRYDTNLYTWGSSDDFVNSLVSNLGVDSREAKNVLDNQKVLVVEVENKRQSVMGVSLDEEMSEMIKFQHSYSANARVLTTMDEMLDLIVNRLGLVGR